jgi:hypothetical protein
MTRDDVVAALLPWPEHGRRHTAGVRSKFDY